MIFDKKKLDILAKEVRKKIIQMSFTAQSAHIGGSLSCVEILVFLYFFRMNVYPKKPLHSLRDRLIFSKAHDCKALYAVLCQRGFFKEEILETYEQDAGLPGHSTRFAVPGVEVSAGSLGHGLSLAVGMAYVGKIDKRKHTIYTILSDGECDEGSTWEAILFAGHHHLDNLVVFIDYNKLQAFGTTDEVLTLEPFVSKWESFGWSVKEVDGHNFDELKKASKTMPFERKKPSVIIAHTTKGKGGVEKHINQVSSQYKPPTKEETDNLLKELL